MFCQLVAHVPLTGTTPDTQTGPSIHRDYESADDSHRQSGLCVSAAGITVLYCDIHTVYSDFYYSYAIYDRLHCSYFASRGQQTG